MESSVEEKKDIGGDMDEAKASIAVIGAGPAGLFAARELAMNGFKVVLFNKSIKPGGLAEYGIYPEKYRLKDGLRAQFKTILQCDDITYFGNVSVGKDQPLKLGDLRGLGFAAVLVTCGAQGTKWLGLPGEDLAGVYHAKTVVLHYNHLPPFSTEPLQIGKKVIVVGVGNVMTDIVRYLTGLEQVEEITTIARRGPAEVKFDRRELEPIIAFLDREAFAREIERVTPAMQAIGQDSAEAIRMIRELMGEVAERKARPCWDMHFLLSPLELLSRDGKNVGTLKIEENSLELNSGEVKARGTGKISERPADTVIFAIGDRVDDELGIPLRGSGFDISASPRYPIDGNSYELAEGQGGNRFEGVFVGGWSRNASTGMVGIARKDGANAARAVLEYLKDHPASRVVEHKEIEKDLVKMGYKAVKTDSLAKLEEKEKEQATEKGLPEFKFDSNEEMLRVMGLV